jgi:hypothetical protein
MHFVTYVGHSVRRGLSICGLLEGASGRLPQCQGGSPAQLARWLKNNELFEIVRVKQKHRIDRLLEGAESDIHK